MSKVVITSPKTKIIKWEQAIAIVEEGKLESCSDEFTPDDIKISNVLRYHDLHGFAIFVCAIVAAMKDTSPGPQRKPRKDKGIKRVVPEEVDAASIRLGEAPENTGPIEIPMVSSEYDDAVYRPKRTRKAKGQLPFLQATIVELANGLFEVCVGDINSMAHGKTVKEAATFALEKAKLTVADLDSFEQTEEVKKLKDVLWQSEDVPFLQV